MTLKNTGLTGAAMKQNVFKRNKDVLWRLNDDDTGLVLSGTTGNAYVLSPAVVSLWIALEDGLTQRELVDSGLTGDESFTGLIDGLIEKGLIVSEDLSEAGAIKQPVSMRQTTISHKAVLSSIQGPYGIDEISFGACECGAVPGQGNRKGKRNVQCNQNGTERTTTSVVIAPK